MSRLFDKIWPKEPIFPKVGRAFETWAVTLLFFNQLEGPENCPTVTNGNRRAYVR
jgi:hypothetical protein